MKYIISSNIEIINYGNVSVVSIKNETGWVLSVSESAASLLKYLNDAMTEKRFIK